MKRTEVDMANECALAEVLFAQDTLFYAANELLRLRSSDPVGVQLGAIADQLTAVASVLRARKER